jgi:hypothetical protein
MFTRIGLALWLFMAAAAWSQVGASDSSQMQISPIVSGGSYSTDFASGVRSNFLSFGLQTTGAYDDNVVVQGAAKPVSDFTYQISPSIALNQQTPRQTISFAYNPGFMFYEPTSELDQTDEVASASYLYRLSPHMIVNARDSFAKTTNVFGQPNALSSGSVSGVPEPETVIAPYAAQTTNSLNGGLSYQFSRDQMIGASGLFRTLDYANSEQAVGLGNSHSSGGSGYYGLRVSAAQYLGFRYGYDREITFFPSDSGTTLSSPQTEVQIHSFDPFYSIVLNHNFSIALSAGAQRVAGTQTTPAGVATNVNLWEPMVTAGLGWQGSRTSVAATLLRTAAGGGGTQGVYNTTGVNATVRWQATPLWTLGGTGSYQNQQNAAPGIFLNVPGGHTVTGGFLLGRKIGTRARVDVGYNRLHQTYSGIASLSAVPDNDHEFVSLSYQLSRPLGR